MTDERLAELHADLAKEDDERIKLKRQLEDSLREIKRMSSECTRLNEARKTLAEPYKLATEKVADLSSQIRAEQTRRDDEAAKAKQAEKEAADKAEAERKAAEEAAKPPE